MTKYRTPAAPGQAAGRSGTINLNGGVFTLNGKSITAGAGTAAVNFDGGTLRLSATNAAIFGSGLTATINGGGAVVDTGAFPGTIGVSLLAGTGSGGLTKQGAATLTLSVDNTYAGPTTVTAGTLSLNGVHTGGGLITVAGGAALCGTASVGGVSVQPGATLAPGNSIGTFAASGDVAILGRLSIELDGTGVGSADFLQVGGALDIGAATVDFIELSPLDDPAYVIASYGSLGGTSFGSVTNLPDGYQIDYHHEGGNQIALTVVPEPGSLGVLGIVSAAFLLRRRLRG